LANKDVYLGFASALERRIGVIRENAFGTSMPDPDSLASGGDANTPCEEKVIADPILNDF
jgi:hypothetical protein